MGCHNSKIIDAPLDRVWSAVRDFHDVGWAPRVVETCEKIGDKVGDQLGARRKLNGVFLETLLGVSDHDHTITYSIDEGPGPLQNCNGYVGRVALSPVTDGDRTLVEWTSSWTTEGGGVKEFCDPIYQALLNDLADNVER